MLSVMGRARNSDNVLGTVAALEFLNCSGSAAEVVVMEREGSHGQKLTRWELEVSVTSCGLLIGTRVVRGGPGTRCGLGLCSVDQDAGLDLPVVVEEEDNLHSHHFERSREWNGEPTGNIRALRMRTKEQRVADGYFEGVAATTMRTDKPNVMGRAGPGRVGPGPGSKLKEQKVDWFPKQAQPHPLSIIQISGKIADCVVR